MDHLFLFRIWNLRQQFKKMPIQTIWELGDSQKGYTYSVRRIFKNSCAASFYNICRDAGGRDVFRCPI